MDQKDNWEVKLTEFGDLMDIGVAECGEDKYSSLYNWMEDNKGDDLK